MAQTIEVVEINGNPVSFDGPDETDPDADATSDLPLDLFLPAISVNEDHDIAIAMQQTSEEEFVSVQGWGRTDAGDETPLKELAIGDAGLPNNSFNRWGDYSAAAPAPDGSTWGVIGEVMMDGGGNPDYWATKFRQIEIEP